MATMRHFTEDEIHDLIDGSEESREYGENGRWTRPVRSVVRTEDGRYWAIDWQRSLTEYGEDEIYEGDYPEVFPTRTLRIDRRTMWLTGDERDDMPVCPPPLRAGLGNIPQHPTFRLDD